MLSAEFGVSNSVANYMTLVFFPTGISKLRMALERVDKGLITNTSLEYENEVKPYLNADKELKRILQSNNMELEDLFHALAIGCEILCIVNFTQVNDCCKYVRKKYLSYFCN